METVICQKPNNSPNHVVLRDDDDDGVKRTGTTKSCVAHIITSVIGSGVLSLAWSTAQLGWIGGPVSMLFFAFVTYVSAFLLSDCYRSPDSVNGKRNKSYMDAVRVNLGRKQTWACGLLQYLSMYGTAVAYVITTSISLRAIQKSNCYHTHGHDAACEGYSNNFYMLMFGVSQILCSLIPDFHNMEWLSVVAAIMSFSYSSIGFALGFAKTIGNGEIRGSIGGVVAPSKAQKIWKVSQALGDIAFSFPYSLILLEIQDTLKRPPAENKTVKKASMISVLLTTFFYLCCGCFGYSAFGNNNTPGNLLTGFYEPFWLIDFANACIVLHLVGGYQVFSQPIFAFADQWLATRFPNNKLANKSYAIKVPCFEKPYKLSMWRLCFRTLYVVTTVAVAVFFPYFNEVLGILGALNFWPLAIYFPVEMYFVQKKVVAWSRKWVLLRTFSFVCLVVSLFALVGSIEGVVREKLR